MEPITTRDAILYSALINAGVGFVLGLIPLVAGLVRKNAKYGFVGLVASAAGGAVLGVFLAVPLSALFTWLVFRGPRPVPGSRSNNRDSKP